MSTAPHTPPTLQLRRPEQAVAAERPSRFLLADDLGQWGEPDRPGGLLAVPTATRLARLEELAADGARLIVLCGEQDESAVSREIAMARTALDIDATVMALPGGPLGQYAVARIAEQAMTVAGRPTSLVVSVLPTLAAALVDLAVLQSVSGLDLPGVGLGHHLASIMPGQRQFAVQLTPRPIVRSMTKDLLGEGFTRAAFGAAGVRVLVCGPQQVPAPFEAVTGIGDLPHRVRTPLDLPGFWGDESATEVVAVPRDPVAWVVQQIPVQPNTPCRWCGCALVASAARCLFCGHRTARLS